MKEQQITRPAALLTISEVAGIFRVSTKTIRRWIDSDELPAHRLGRQWRIAPKDLHHFLRDHRR